LFNTSSATGTLFPDQEDIVKRNLWTVLSLLLLLSLLAACTQATPQATTETKEATATTAPTVEKATAVQKEEPKEEAKEIDVMKIINSPEVNEAALASDYSQAILKDMATAVDTSAYKKDGPYTIAVSQQDPSNGWGNTYNITIAAYGKELQDKGVLAGPLLTSITNDANQQISDIENFIEQQPDAIVVEPLGRAASTTVISGPLKPESPLCSAPMALKAKISPLVWISTFTRWLISRAWASQS
jgi:ABC-type sugar transport system substrate-binding protein